MLSPVKYCLGIFRWRIGCPGWRGNAVARAYDNRVRQVTVAYGDNISDITVVNSELLSGHQDTHPHDMQRGCFQQGIIQAGFESGGGTAGFEFF